MGFKIRDIKLEDVQTMMKWGKFTDPRYLHFNFPYTEPSDFKIWYQYKVDALGVKAFGAFVDELLIGFVTFKKINYLFNRAELGVIFDMNYVSKGYGYLTIVEVLKRVKFRKVYLYVSTYNNRAYKAYVKLGFKASKIEYKLFENQDIINDIDDGDEDFLKKNGKLYGKYVKMEKYL
ncbi:MAG: GNAT family N-acetyltransferase [Clostridiales bacterium]|nr:GNAT family N-acetyltransferase [Clostridiales bacterium]